MATQPLLVAHGNVGLEERDPEESIATPVELIAKAGLVVHEVPSYEHVGVRGQSHLHALRDGTRVLHIIAAESRRRFRRRRRRAEAPRVSNHNPPLSLDGAG